MRRTTAPGPPSTLGGAGHHLEGRLMRQHLADQALGGFGNWGAVDQAHAGVCGQRQGGERFGGAAAALHRAEPPHADPEPGHR